MKKIIFQPETENTVLVEDALSKARAYRDAIYLKDREGALWKLSEEYRRGLDKKTSFIFRSLSVTMQGLNGWYATLEDAVDSAVKEDLYLIEDQKDLLELL